MEKNIYDETIERLMALAASKELVLAPGYFFLQDEGQVCPLSVSVLEYLQLDDESGYDENEFTDEVIGRAGEILGEAWADGFWRGFDDSRVEDSNSLMYRSREDTKQAFLEGMGHGMKLRTAYDARRFFDGI